MACAAPRQNQTAPWRTTVVSVMGGLCAVLGLTVMVGWYTHTLRLLTVYPGCVAMAFNTALAFFLAGAALTAMTWGRFAPARAGAVGVITIGLLTLGEYVFGRDLGIDELVMREYIRAGIVNPARMAFCTALCFSLAGAALLLSSWTTDCSPRRQGWRLGVTGLLGALIVGLGIVALSGYFTGITAAYAWGHLTRMALHTAVGFVGLGGGLIAFARHKELAGPHAPEASGPVWLPGMAAIAGATATLCLWQALIVEQSAQTALINQLTAGSRAGTAAPFVQSQSLIPLGCLVSGLLLASLLAWAIYLAQTSQRRTAEIGAINAQLQAQVTERRRAEEALQRAKDDLEARVQERTADLGTVNEYLHHEVTERRLAEETLLGEQSRLREQRAFLRQVIDTDPNFIYVKDIEGRFLLANAAVSEAYGTVPETLVGRSDADFSHSADEIERLRRSDRELLTSGGTQSVQEETFTDAQGRQRRLQTVKRPLTAVDGVASWVLSISADITERKALEAERERLLAEALERADHDPLTGLANHRAFHKRLQEEADRAQRQGTSLAVAVVDLDNFKFFNDAYGHPVGDDVLRQVAAALLGGNRSYDTLARFGGDEFALLLPGVGPDEASQLPNRLASRLSDVGYTPPGYDSIIPIGASIGVAVFPDEAPTRAETLALADTRLRRAKAGGGTGEDPAERLRGHLPATAHEGFDLLLALVTAVDTKDRYTRRHSEDVLTYSLEIAQGLGLDEETRHTIAVAALLHDIGKVGVPDHVLRKPGTLTAEEFRTIQQHPTMGAAIVGAVAGFEETLDAVRHHHERWDGRGYPSGLLGEQTPLIARLMAVADAFSAMTTDRPYRKGMSATRALSILETGAGTQWDPQCVKALLRFRATTGANRNASSASPTPVDRVGHACASAIPLPRASSLLP